MNWLYGDHLNNRSGKAITFNLNLASDVKKEIEYMDSWTQGRNGWHWASIHLLLGFLAHLLAKYYKNTCRRDL
jgi:hypothetical protein